MVPLHDSVTSRLRRDFTLQSLLGLIFANIGLGLTVGGQPVIAATTFLALVVMVMVTTVVTPPALKWSLHRAAAKRAPR
jgi:membrane protein YdbS with pleckstrin-like domain